MGEAKRRGTFEERKAVALKIAAKKWKSQRLVEIAKRRSMTPEEKEQERRTAEFFTTLYGITGAFPYQLR
jgi:hypothetical protein